MYEFSQQYTHNSSSTSSCCCRYSSRKRRETGNKTPFYVLYVMRVLDADFCFIFDTCTYTLFVIPILDYHPQGNFARAIPTSLTPEATFTFTAIIFSFRQANLRVTVFWHVTTTTTHELNTGRIIPLNM